MAFDPITAGLEFGRTLIDAIVSRIPDPGEAARTRAALEQAQAAASHAQTLAQIEVNRAEAGSASLFVAGWRPGAGWVCVAGLGYVFLAQPLLAWGAAMAQLPGPPTIDTELFGWLIGGLLGLGGWRSLDKRGGVATDAVAPLAGLLRR